jgi:hypothetical protein
MGMILRFLIWAVLLLVRTVILIGGVFVFITITIAGLLVGGLQYLIGGKQ